MNYILSYSLTVGVLILVAFATRARGWPLALMLFTIYFGISWINTIDEAALFAVLPLNAALRGLLTGAAIALVLSGIVALMLSRARVAADRPQALISGWIWRLLAGASVYAVLYLVAGSLVYPYIKDFYASKPIPSLGKLIAIQLLRGALYIAMVLPVIRRMPGLRLRAGIVLGLCYAILGGISPLLLNNEYMPPNIRLAHSFEVGTENFLFGMIVAALLVTSKSSRLLKQDA